MCGFSIKVVLHGDLNDVLVRNIYLFDIKCGLTSVHLVFQHYGTSRPDLNVAVVTAVATASLESECEPLCSRFQGQEGVFAHTLPLSPSAPH